MLTNTYRLNKINLIINKLIIIFQQVVLISVVCYILQQILNSKDEY